MKKNKYFSVTASFKLAVIFLISLSFCCNELIAQDSTATAPVVKKKKYVKNTFNGNLLVDNQSVMVPIKGTFEFYIQHRFGTISNGTSDLFGIYSSAIMRLSASYVPIKNLQVGFGSTNDKMQIDGNLKYAILKQTTDWKMPISVTFYGNVAMDTRSMNSSIPIVNTSDRLTYFSQLIIASKICNYFSFQIAPDISYFNNVPAYLDTKGEMQPSMKNAHLAISCGGKLCCSIMISH